MKFQCPSHWYSRPVKTLLIGCGGTGSETLDALHRIHLCLLALDGHGLDVTVYDDDDVALNNIGRQRFWQDDVGQNKAVVSVQRINYCNGLEWKAMPFRFEAGMLAEQSFDLIVTAVDSGKLRYEIGQFANGRTMETLWFDAGVSGYEGQAICGNLGHPQHGQRIPNVYDLYKEGLLTKEKTQEPEGGCTTLAASLAAQGLFVNRLASDILGDTLFSLIRHGEIAHHGSYFRISPTQVKPLEVDPHVWLTFGYSAD